MSGPFYDVRKKDLSCLVSIAAWMNFLLAIVYWLKIDFLNYWISRPLHWWEKRESAFAFVCFIFCAACIHTFMFARERLHSRKVRQLIHVTTASLIDQNPAMSSRGRTAKS
jgi:hypothetical protein